MDVTVVFFFVHVAVWCGGVVVVVVVSLAVLEVEVVQRGGGRLGGADCWLCGGDGADGDGCVESGLRWDLVEEVGEGLGGDYGGVAEVFEFLCTFVSLAKSGQDGGEVGEHTALMVLMERLT